MDNTKYQYEGLKWLHEMELLNHPQAINNIRFNILMVSKQIKEVELLIYRENHAMLVELKLSWLGRKFYKRRIFEDVQDALTQLLPSFRFRVTDDPRIMIMAVERVKKALTGGSSENVNDSNGNGVALDSDGQLKTGLPSDSTTPAVTRSPEDSQASPQEQPASGAEIRPDAGDSDRKQS